MTRALLVYSTVEGHSRRISHVVADQLAGAGIEADIENVERIGRDVRPADYDAVFVVAAIHFGRHRRAIRRWAARHAAALNQRPTAFITVCLSVRDHTEDADRLLLRAILDFCSRSGWHPEASKIVAGALSYTQYGWFRTLMVKRLARAKGDPTDTTRDWVFTDWDDLAAFVAAFTARHELGVRPAVLV